MKTDSTYIKEIISNPDYDYLGDIESAQVSSSSSMPDLDIPSPHSYDVSKPLVIAVLVIAAIAIALAVVRYYRKPGDISIVDDATEGMGDDTIFGHEWHKEIEAMLNSKRYAEVVVLCYLRKLSDLNDKEAICFSRSKTPNMFIQEATKTNLIDPAKATATEVSNLRTLTHHYLRIRYGHKPADAVLANNMLSL